jgi:hypothetical protein
MAERKSKGEKLPSVKSVRSRALSLSRLFLSLSLSLSFLALKRAFLSSKVALSENLSQIHQNCGREGNETRLREKDFEREHAEPKKAEPKKKNKRERERETEEQKQRERRERAFFSFFVRFSLSLFVFSLFSSCVSFDFFSLARRVFSARQKHSNKSHSFRTTLVFSTYHTFLSLKVSLSVSLSLSVSSLRRTHFSVWDF